MPLAHDMIGLYFAVGNANHLPPWGGLDMLLSTNPIAVAVPAGDEPPVVLDMATTVAAYGKVKAKAQRGEPMPVGWMIDRLGQPLTDPKRAEEGFLLPIGGYKGYGLALIVGLLAGTLNGAAMGKDVIDFNHDDTTHHQHRAGDHGDRPRARSATSPISRRASTALVRDLRASERMPGVERIWLPGEQSHARRAANERDGIPLPLGLAQAARHVCARDGHSRIARDLIRIPWRQHDDITASAPLRAFWLLGLLCSSAALAQSPPAGYPNKPIRMIVPLAAGSAVDNAARILAQKMGQNMGQSIVIENQPGAAGLIGADRVAKVAARWLHARRLQRQHHDHAAQPAAEDALGHPA